MSRQAQHAPEIQAELAKGHKPVTSLLLITGPREGVTRDTVAKALRPHFSPEVMLVEGEAEGVDKHAASLWEEWGGLVERHPVSPGQWRAAPRTAGFDRNHVMVQRLVTAGNGKVVAIDLPCTKDDCHRPEPHNTHGTSQCVHLADKAGLPVEHFPASTPQTQAQAVAPHPEAAHQVRDSQVRHSWTGDHTRVCGHDGCRMTAAKHWLPDSQRAITVYSKDGRSIVADRVPTCGQPLPEPGFSEAERQQMATEADAQAGHAMKARDHDRAIRLLTVCRALDPSRSDLWSKHESVVRSAHQPDRSQPSMQSAGRKRVWLGSDDSGKPYYGEQLPCINDGCQHELVRAPGSADDICLKCTTGQTITAAQIDPEAHGLPPGTDLAPQIELGRRLNAQAVARHQGPLPQPRPAVPQPAIQPARQIQMEATT